MNNMPYRCIVNHIRCASWNSIKLTFSHHNGRYESGVVAASSVVR